jgi:hypothetical protein
MEQVANEKITELFVYQTIPLIKRFLICWQQGLTVHHVAIKETQFKGDFHHITEVIDQGLSSCRLTGLPMRFSATK